ncbi:MAG: pyruvate kinase [Brachymonas sp.]|nr:pyruvate kinase [Brachymonas sp.]
MAHPAEDNADFSPAEVEALLQELTAIRAELVAEPGLHQHGIDKIHAHYQSSARNLLHYLALRRRDLRPLQLRLAALGLSSLGRAESHVLATVDAVLAVLHRLAGRAWQPPASGNNGGFARGEQLLAEHTDALLGSAAPGRKVRIMVTMPSEAAHDYTLVHDLLKQGMDCMRINCAHDDAQAWERMIGHLRRAEEAMGRSCRVVMDLGGPKLRTGPLEPDPAVVKVRPVRDGYGRVTAPARVWLTAEDAPQPPPSQASASLPVPADWLRGLQTSDRVTFTDVRDAERSFAIVDVTDAGCWAEAQQTAYLTPGTVLQHAQGKASVGALPPGESTLTLQEGDTLFVTRDLRPGRPATVDSSGQVPTPASVGCTIPEVFDDVRSGESIWFDDGKMGGVVEKVEADRVRVRITHAPAGGAKLRSDKGINLPDSPLRLAALTDKDLHDLPFVARHADVVELSFANSAHDVESLQQHLAQLGERQPAIVLKIETRRAFENLPAMLLVAMRTPCCGVMIARGDLAVECGFERLAEVQEEILWICEAAHVPVIWATQVLESLAKQGMPSRAEITDAAMGHRAECVMLNKGPHMLSAVRVLDDILRRMQAHQAKKSAMLRELRLAHTLPAEPV